MYFFSLVLHALNPRSIFWIQMMYDACFGEFIAAMVYYNQCRDIHENKMFMHKLCAVMYPLKPWDPDNIRFEDFESLPFEECLTYLNTEHVSFDEVPGEYSGGTAGIFFTFTIDIPVNLEYDESDWNRYIPDD